MEKKLPDHLAQIEKEWNRPGLIRLIFQDEARFGRIAQSKRCWCPSPVRPVCPTMVCQENTYAYGAVSIADGRWDSLILPKANTVCMQIFLDEIASRYPDDRIVMVFDGASWHRSGKLVVPENMRLLPLPPYSPELNPVENIWEELREKGFDNKVFASLEALEVQLLYSLKYLEDHPEISKSIAGWPWVVNAIYI